MVPPPHHELSQPRAVSPSGGHLYPLDAARGVAALAVGVYHWSHLLESPPGAETVDRARLPFVQIFGPIYDAGFRAVPLFFTLSGFIFFWLYRRAVAEGRISAPEFAWRRFSRLYPLHLATLLLMAVLGFEHRAVTGWNYGNSPDDVPHFIAHFFLVTAWWPPHIAFNGAVWSISIELILYALFFVLARWGGLRGWTLPLALCGLGYLLEVTNMPLAGRNLIGLGTGFYYFFLGGMACFGWEWLERKRWPRGWMFAGLAGVVLGALALEQIRHPSLPLGAVIYRSLELPHDAPFTLKLYDYLTKLPRMHITTVAFPALLIALGLAGSKWPAAARRFKVLGQMSYSSYLLHRPLQVCFSIGAAMLGLPRSCFYSPALFLLYFALLIPLSIACYRYLERPAQERLRRWFDDRRAAASGKYPTGSES